MKTLIPMMEKEENNNKIEELIDPNENKNINNSILNSSFKVTIFLLQ